MIPNIAPHPSPHSSPSVWSGARPGRFASTIVPLDSLAPPHVAEAVLAGGGVALLGVPDDMGVTLNHGRPGAREGPRAFREALCRYGAAVPMGQGDGRLAYPRVYPRVVDIGDVMPGTTLAETHNRVTETVRAIIGHGLFPVVIGGGHDLTFPVVRGAAGAHGPLRGVYFDAHLDVRPEPGSGMSFRALLEAGHARELTLFGVDPLVNTREHFEYFASRGGRLDAFEPAAWPATLEKQFVSLDLDALDASFAPGVSAMNPSGMPPGRVGDYLEAAGRCPSVAVLDIMELSPPHDEHGRTARLAAHLFLRFLAGLSERTSQ